MSYVAVVLSEVSRNLLIEKMKEFVPNSFELLAHHMTMHMGPATPEDALGSPVFLVADRYAIDDKVCAVGLCKGGEISQNKIPHVTVAVDRKANGRPVMSNNLTNWKKFPPGVFICLQGTIQECK